MPDYPLFFKVSHEVRCPAFAVRIVTSGRALMVFEDDKWWCHGVEPGGVTAHGKGPGMAYAAFKATLGEIWEEAARDCKDFGEFENLAQSLTAQTDEEEATRWEAARQEIRAGREVEWTFADVRRETGEWPIGASMAKLDRVSAGVEDLALAEKRVA